MKVLTKCLNTHKDGFGAMYRYEGRIAIIKGLFTIDQITKIADHISVDTEACFHFRMATHGNVSAGNCHPFPLSPKVDALQKTSGVFDNGVMHNGIISGFGYRNTSSLSDTMNLIRCISTHTKIYNMRTLGRFIKPHYGKFVIMTPEWTYYWGDFIKDNGLLFSNSTYKDYTYTKVTYSTKVSKVPFVEIVDPKDVEQWGGFALYDGMCGTIHQYKGVTIFTEYDYSEDDLNYLKDEIELAFSEGELPGILRE